jgi:hypothetical protein
LKQTQSDVKEELDDDHHYEKEIDKKLDEAREAIEGKRVAADAELKGPDWDNATKENDKDAKVEN